MTLNEYLETLIIAELNEIEKILEEVKI